MHQIISYVTFVFAWIRILPNRTKLFIKPALAVHRIIVVNYVYEFNKVACLVRNVVKWVETPKPVDSNLMFVLMARALGSDWL